MNYVLKEHFDRHFYDQWKGEAKKVGLVFFDETEPRYGLALFVFQEGKKSADAKLRRQQLKAKLKKNGRFGENVPLLDYGVRLNARPFLHANISHNGY